MGVLRRLLPQPQGKTGRRESNPLPPGWKLGALAEMSYCRVVAGVGLEPPAYETGEHAAAPPR